MFWTERLRVLATWALWFVPAPCLLPGRVHAESAGPDTTEVYGATAKVHSDVLRPETALQGLKLQEDLRGNVPDTVARVPGVWAAYNGPGATRLTIRGLGGDRVRMLDDGYHVGDLYWSASDHGVMVEPLTAHRMEVVRGPATLVYGGNALGGVVNVVTDQIPKPTDTTWANVGLQAESASLGIAQGGTVVAPLGPFALRLEESVRRSDDVQTAAGPIPNTQVQALGGGVGLGWHPDWGVVGAALRYYQNHYGVPGEFAGELIPGGHPGGAGIEARRINARLQASYLPTTSQQLERLEWGASLTRYRHDEVEGVIDGRRALGAAFELDTLQTRIVARHKLFTGGPLGVVRGAAGLSATAQDLLAGGNSPGVRSGTDWGLAGFVFERLDLGDLSFHAGLRYEHRRLAPLSTAPIRVQTAERTIDKAVHPRNFNLLSGSLAALWQFAEGWTLGSTVARSARAPNLQELYSDGPHLADFSFDIGTPGLPTEVGTGVDLFVLAEKDGLILEATGFVNHVGNYVLYAPTLETLRVFREGARPRATPVFEAQAVDALFVGVEGKLQLPIAWGLSFNAMLSYVWAENRDDGAPLPYIPPLGWELELRYEQGGFFATGRVSGALRQGRVPRPTATGDGLEQPQTPTAGYALAHASAGWRGYWLDLTHTISLRGFNLTNRVWRNHLSRIKDVAPQMGLNLALTYQLLY